MSIIVSIVEFVVAFAAGGYLEYRFSSKVTADIVAVKTDAAAVEVKAKADAAAVIADVKKI